MEAIYEYINIISFFDTINLSNNIGEIGLTKDNGSYVISTERFDYICDTYEEFYRLICYIKKRFHNENEVYSYFDIVNGKDFEI